MSTTDLTASQPACRQRRSAAERALLYGLVLLLGSGFGLQYAMARRMGLEAVDPVGALFGIHLVLSAVFLAILGLTRRLFLPRRGHLLFFVAIALFGNLGQLGVELVAAHHVPAGELTLIVSLQPVVVLLFTFLLGTEPLGPRKVSGLATGCAAATTMLLPQALAGEAALAWVAFAFLAPVSQAVGAVIMAARWPRQLDPLQVATGNMVMATVLLAPLAAGGGGLRGFDGGPSDANLALWVFALTVGAEFYIFAVLTRRGGAVLASCADFIAIGAGLVLGFLFFGEVPSPWMWAAAGLCLVALKLATDG